MTTEPEATTKPRIRYGWASIAVAVVFGVLYAYILWDAIGNLIQLPRALDASSVPWGLLIVDVALPVVAFVAAFWIGRRHTLPARLLLFVVGFTLLACCTVGSIAFVQHS
ncbi:MAG TPA: hypothetical protein VGM94_12225 [Galbitalea sp.]|jgi:hypothetical protein